MTVGFYTFTLNQLLQLHHSFVYTINIQNGCVCAIQSLWSTDESTTLVTVIKQIQIRWTPQFWFLVTIIVESIFVKSRRTRKIQICWPPPQFPGNYCRGIDSSNYSSGLVCIRWACTPSVLVTSLLCPGCAVWYTSRWTIYIANQTNMSASADNLNQTPAQLEITNYNTSMPSRIYRHEPGVYFVASRINF